MRGKHGAAAAVRQEVRSRDAEIEAYRSAVKRLTAERDAARTELAAQRRSAAKVERELRARLDQAAAPRVEALQRELAVAKQERDRAQGYLRQFGEQAENARGILTDLLVAQGMSRDAADERQTEILPLATGWGIGHPNLVVDMTGTHSIAANDQMIGTNKLRVRAMNGDKAALEQYRRIRNARLGRARKPE